MGQATVTVGKTPQPLPSGASFAKTTIKVVDSAGTPQQTDVTGGESPPWQAIFNGVADGDGTYSAEDFDANGNSLGTAVSTVFTMGGGQPATFQASSSISVSQTG